MVGLNAGAFAALITILILGIFSAVCVILTKLSRRHATVEVVEVEEGKARPEVQPDHRLQAQSQSVARASPLLRILSSSPLPSLPTPSLISTIPLTLSIPARQSQTHQQKPLPTLPVFRNRASLSSPTKLDAVSAHPNSSTQSVLSPLLPIVDAANAGMRFLLRSPSHRSRDSKVDLRDMETMVKDGREYELDAEIGQTVAVADTGEERHRQREIEAEQKGARSVKGENRVVEKDDKMIRNRVEIEEKEELRGLGLVHINSNIDAHLEDGKDEDGGEAKGKAKA